MDKTQVKEILKGMFKNNEIEVKLENRSNWGNSSLILSILIDDKEVYKYEETLGE